jgi:hypothetical protein
MHHQLIHCLTTIAVIVCCAFAGFAVVDRVIFGHQPGQCIRDFTIIVVSITVHLSAETATRIVRRALRLRKR